MPRSAPKPFTPQEDALLGTAPDAEIARRIGRHPSSVQSRRLKLGMAYRHTRKRRPWTPKEDALLGTASDTEIATRLDRHVATVCVRRQKVGDPQSLLATALWAPTVTETSVAWAFAAIDGARVNRPTPARGLPVGGRVLELGIKRGREALVERWRALRRGWYCPVPSMDP